MIKQTSLEAHRDAGDGGLLEHKREIALWVLQQLGSATGGEVFKYWFETRRLNARPNWSFSSTLNELSRMRKIESFDKRVCTVTGRKVLVWRLTDPGHERKLAASVKVRCPSCQCTGHVSGDKALKLNEAWDMWLESTRHERIEGGSDFEFEQGEGYDN